MDLMTTLFFTKPIVVALNCDDNNDNDNYECDIDYPTINSNIKGPGRGWGGARSDGGRYTKSTKMKQQEAPKRPKPKKKEHVRERNTEIEEFEEDIYDVFYDYDDSWDGYSYYTDIGRWEREENPMPPCTNTTEAWALMKTSPTTFEKIYSAHFGGFMTLGYRETYNVISSIVMEWTEKNPLNSILTRQFIAELFGADYKIQRTPWIFTKTARNLADELFGITAFHNKLKNVRSFISANRVKETCSQTGGFAIPFKPWRELLNKVNDPEELLRATSESRINKVLDDKYLIWLQGKVVIQMYN